MSENDADTDSPPADGPRRAEGASSTGYPTLADRRRHQRKLALWAGGAAAVGAAGLAMVAAPEANLGVAGGMRMPDQGASPPRKDPSWLQSRRNPDPPPRLMGEIAAPLLPTEEEPAKGPGCEVPRPPPDDDHLRVKGDISMPVMPKEPGPEPGLDGEEPRVKGQLARPTPPRMPGSIEPLQIQPGDAGEDPHALPPDLPLEYRGIGDVVDGDGLRSVFLSGATRDGTPFTACVRIDPEDDVAARRIQEARVPILTALSPLAEKGELSREATAWSLVQRMVPGTVVRQAGVLR